MPNSSEGEGIVLGNDKQEGSAMVGTSEAESERVALLHAVVDCAPNGGDASNPAGVVGGLALLNAPNGRCILSLQDDTRDGTAIILMQQAMCSPALEQGVHAPWVDLVETCGHHGDWVCRVVGCPDSDACVTVAEGRGATLGEATARCFVALFGTGSPATEEPTQPPGPEGKTEKSRGEKV